MSFSSFQMPFQLNTLFSTLNWVKIIGHLVIFSHFFNQYFILGVILNSKSNVFLFFSVALLFKSQFSVLNWFRIIDHLVFSHFSYNIQALYQNASVFFSIASSIKYSIFYIQFGQNHWPPL